MASPSSPSETMNDSISIPGDVVTLYNRGIGIDRAVFTGETFCHGIGSVRRGPGICCLLDREKDQRK
jgi:hypothetical protein